MTEGIGTPDPRPLPAAGPAETGLRGFARRVFRGIGAMSFGAAVNVASQLVIVPSAIAAWGPGHYGEWIVLSGAVIFLQLADVGVQTHAVNSLCASHARGDLAEFQATLRDAVAVQVRIVTALAAIVGIVLCYAPIGRWFSLHTVDNATAAWTLGLLSLDFLLNIPLGVIAGVYRATGRFPRNAMMGAVQKLALLIATVVLLYLRQGFIAISLVRLCITLSGAVWLAFDFPRLYPWLRPHISGADLRRGFAMLAPGALFLMIPMADYASNQISLMIAQHRLSGFDVATLATHRTIFNSGQMAANFLMASLWPEFTALHAHADQSRLLRLHATLTKINGFLVLFVVGGMLLGGEELYPLWTRKELHFDRVLAALLATKTLCWGYWSVSSMALMSINRQAPVARAAILNSAISVALAFVLIPWIGIRGSALASLIGDLTISVWFIPKIAMEAIGGSYRSYLLGPTRAIALAILLPAVIFWLAPTLQTAAGPIRDAVFLLGLASLAIGVAFAFDKTERGSLRSIFRWI